MWSQFWFFLNYALGAFLINYFFLPTLYYKKKYISFAASVLVVLVLMILLEEFVVEKVFYPYTRGRRFPGILYSLADILPPVAILAGFKFAWDATRKQQKLDQLQVAVKESQLQFLKNQINPHFLFNNLNNLYSYAIENSPKTPAIILELSSVLRYMLHDCRENYVSLDKEIRHLKNFTALYKLQIEDRGRVEFKTMPVSGRYRIAPLILSVFIENAFKHSMASQSRGIEISIEMKLSDEGEFCFFCSNTYQHEANKKQLSQGLGLENVQKRLELLYPGSHKLSFARKEGHYEVNLRIKLTEDE